MGARFANFCKYFLVFGVILSENLTKTMRLKRADIDLQTCIDNFNVHKDKIIRTQDSQTMGAKYLNEIDLGSREECLRLCCETDDCDVFVFEEKNAGSCYLFQCGPPEDFKCKFTHHVNYSSGVLSINRHLPDLESQIKLTKHEQDLNKLRKPEVEQEPNGLVRAAVDVKKISTTTTTTASTKEVLPVMKAKDVQEEVATRKCSRFQFECRSTGECIGIYNACDGIPQCADGSDEAPELGCPDSLTTAAPPAAIRMQADQKGESNAFGAPIEPMKMDKIPLQMSPQNLYRPEVGAMQPVEPDFLPLMGGDPKTYNPHLQYGPQQMPAYVPQIAMQGQPNWMARQPMQIPQYEDKNSHIFTHKETGLQVPDGQDISKMQYPDGINAIREYPKVPKYNPDNYKQLITKDNWSPPMEEVRYPNANDRYIEKAVQDEIFKKSDQLQYKSITSNESTDRAKENPKHVQEKMAHDLKHSKDSMEHGNAKIKIEKYKTSQQEQYPDVQPYKMVDDMHDGVAETPHGAVLSLTLGLIITCVMAVLIGCRVKMVRRRLRKNGKSYAHDADYLVNGMYL